jgi:hypothetical protein
MQFDCGGRLLKNNEGSAEDFLGLVPELIF